MVDYDPITDGVRVRMVGADGVVKTHITHDGGTTQPIATFAAGTIIEEIVFVVTEAWNGTRTVDIGVAGTTNALLPTASITYTLGAVSGEDESTRGSFLYSTHRRCKYLAAGTVVNATLGSLGTTTTGEADVIITYSAP